MPETKRIVALWASTVDHPAAFVGAWAGSLDDADPEGLDRRIEAAQEEFGMWDPESGPWTFTRVHQTVMVPEATLLSARKYAAGEAPSPRAKQQGGDGP